MIWRIIQNIWLLRDVPSNMLAGRGETRKHRSSRGHDRWCHKGDSFTCQHCLPGQTQDGVPSARECLDERHLAHPICELQYTRADTCHVKGGINFYLGGRIFYIVLIFLFELINNESLSN